MSYSSLQSVSKAVVCKCLISGSAVFTICCFISCFSLSPYTCVLVWGVLNVQRAPWVHGGVCEAELCPHLSAVSALPLQMG